jgi:cytochrome c
MESTRACVGLWCAVLSCALLLGLGLCHADDTLTLTKPGSASAVAALYRQRCQRCHEADGKGKDTDVPDFSDGRWQSTRTDAQFLVSILDGKGSAMPAFRGRISEQEARDLVSFVRAYATAGSRANDFESRFRELQDELLALQKQFRELSVTTHRVQARP